MVAPDTDTNISLFQGTMFSGVFDGNDYTISNLTISAGTTGNDYLGLFGCMSVIAIVKHLGVENVAITGSGSDSCGGIAGLNRGTINDSHSSGSISGHAVLGGVVGGSGEEGSNITRCYSSADVNGSGSGIGGLAGETGGGGNIVESYATGAVTGSGNMVGGLVGLCYSNVVRCYATGNVIGAGYVGGLIGRAEYVTDCFARGNVTLTGGSKIGGLIGYQGPGWVSRCYSTGYINGSSSSGGLIGYVMASTVSASFWDTDTSGKTSSAGGTGKTTSQMQDVSIFISAGWDFVGETANGTNDYWQMFGGMYPNLVFAGESGAVLSTPVFSPGGGTYYTAHNIVVICATPGATIHYTTNGVDPTESDPVIISGESVYVDHTLTLKAKAWNGIMTPSAVRTATYTIVVATPAFSLSPGTYYSEQNVVITCSTVGATIHYTTNGVDPNESDPVIASGSSVYVDHSLTLKAKAWRSGWSESSVKSAAYYLVVAKPVFDPNGGTYCSEQNVIVTCSTPGAVVRYTTNGVDPNMGDPVIASGGKVPVTVDPPTVLKARAWRTGWLTSDIMTASYRSPVHVSPAGNDSSDGWTWATAKATLQAALDMAVAGDEIWVAAGTYRPTSDYGLVAGSGEVQDRLKHFRMKNGVGIYGGFIGNETDRSQRVLRDVSNSISLHVIDSNDADPNMTYISGLSILSGDIGLQNDASDNVYHVLYHPSGTALDCNAVLDGFVITGGNANGSSPHDAGGGLYCIDSGPTITYCHFVRNKASFYGGGAADLSTGKLVMTSCTFLGNEGCGTAGVRDVGNCIYVGNTGIAAMYVDFWGTVYDNWQFAATNCTFVANPTYAAFANIGSYYAAFYTTNNIFWGNSYTYGDTWNGGGQFDHCYVQGWPPYPADPAFVRNPGRGADNTWGTADDDYGDLRLKVGSPCVDAGGNADANAPDLVGNPRVFDGNGDGIATVDIGAYERQCVTNPVGDVSYDCGVEFVDYAMLANWWGQSCSSANWWCYMADVDQSGTVDILDMAALVEHWLEGVAAGGS